VVSVPGSVIVHAFQAGLALQNMQPSGPAGVDHALGEIGEIVRQVRDLAFQLQSADTRIQPLGPGSRSGSGPDNAGGIPGSDGHTSRVVPTHAITAELAAETTPRTEYSRINLTTSVTDLADRAGSYAMPAQIVDGQDADAVEAAVAATLTRPGQRRGRVRAIWTPRPGSPTAATA